VRLPVALRRAEAAMEQLAPLVERVEVVGSVRRSKPEVKDIELLIEPRMVAVDLFGTPGPDLEPIRGLVAHWGDLAKNGRRYIQVVDGDARERVQWDLFLCHPPAEWGALKVIRTGPAEFSMRCVQSLRNHGYICRDGGVYRSRLRGGELELVPSGDPIPTPTERDFLELCGLRWIEPEDRS